MFHSKQLALAVLRETLWLLGGNQCNSYFTKFRRESQSYTEFLYFWLTRAWSACFVYVFYRTFMIHYKQLALAVLRETPWLLGGTLCNSYFSKLHRVFVFRIIKFNPKIANILNSCQHINIILQIASNRWIKRIRREACVSIICLLLQPHFKALPERSDLQSDAP